ncbi:membrane protein [Streptomyces sp. TS71-3]|nr:membrane protein [Streptomyces sp. TS71-3]
MAALGVACGIAFAGARAGAGLLVALAGVVCFLVGVLGLYAGRARVSADAYGVHSRTLLRRRSTPWRDIADLAVHLQRGRFADIHRAVVVLRDGRRRRLPLPVSGSSGDKPGFDANLEALRALHRRYGAPESDHLPVISLRSAGRGTTGWLLACVLLLAAAGLAAWFVPVAGAEQRAWRAAAPCTAKTPAAQRAECLTTVPAVIARTEVGTGKRPSYLYFAEGSPMHRMSVSSDGAQGFRPGDHVELTVWRHQVEVVSSERFMYRAHFAGAGSVAAVAAVCVLAAGYPGAVVLMRRRGRRLPDDEVLPSALPFAGALAGTALWLVPLCYLHPTTLVSSPVAIAWGAGGVLATLFLFTWAWRATRVRAPGEARGAGRPGGSAGTGNGKELSGKELSGEQRNREGTSGGDVFLPARFLDPTDYNPNAFGTHIVFGDEPPAVVPHCGPGRFAARRIPVERLTVTGMRRVRGDDGDTVPRGWQVAELDDAGEPVRLAAAPDDLPRVIRKLGLHTSKTPYTPSEAGG